ncbi:MAG: S41 family peptidase [Anaerolineae bacterium]|jgi:C-terminal processing protease CtpA/Prc|nr:S41 family peptidase [Anaerolineae bacterium]
MLKLKSNALLFLLLCVVSISFAQGNDFPPADIENDEGGVVVITGEVEYTNPFFTTGVTQPLVLLEDQAGFVDRNEYFTFPIESQTLGQITSDFYSSPFTYSIALPIEPQGTLRDVDQDNGEDTGVMVFAVAYWDNTWGDPYLEVRDQSGGGWSTAYASTRISENPETLREVVGGKLLIYAPDDQQGFPSGFGEDGLLFTEDDPIVGIPQGYTVVDLDSDPFTFDRSSEQSIDLIEPEGSALVDFSDMGYAEAFNAMVDMMKNEYAFTEYKNIDWERIREKYLPRFEQADEDDDEQLYLESLAEMLWSIPDGHVAMSPLTDLVPVFWREHGRGIGIVIQETSDGRAYVTTVIDGSPADDAGIEVGAEILEIDGDPVSEYVSRISFIWGETFSTPHNRRLGQFRHAARFSEDIDEVTITFQNDGDDPVTDRLRTEEEVDSYFATFEDNGLTGYELPVSYRLLDNGYMYVAIYSFFDDRALTIQLWERMIRQMNENDVTGLVIDMRFNGGGNGFLADQMSAYFFDEPLEVGNTGTYSKDLGEFFFDPRGVRRMYLPNEDLRYDGPISMLIGPSCASACERFAYNLTLEDRAAVIGHYPTAGLGGSVNDFLMPGGITVRYTIGRGVDMDGEIHIEGTGVEPTILIPITTETLFGDEDELLDAAIEHLDDEN